ncbi:sulfatase [Rubripirellula reticaptiva]|uniref:Choline-sulfatase n=1 Tax=Rubripirellula reticaptiva TaxID=2528013 RepID=A0A5C6ENR2_9BACT|nr:sulfatase [Rubripirellula reticaptiva]TWU51393.1 Choline-sulfatase [Rubripirellula reticaptiva]
MKALAFLSLILLFSFAGDQSVSLCTAANRPNVLFIAVDDLNDYISPLDNHSGVKTPNFERLAKRSVTFTNAHCAAPACHPSRVAVMTGVHPSRSGVYRNLFGAHGPRWRDESPALKDAVVLSQHFRDHGYRAVGGGKIFHTLQWTPGDSQNDPDAWDDYRGDPLDPISGDWPRPVFSQGQNAGFTGKRPLNYHLFGAAVITDQAEDTYGDHLVVDWATEQMQREGDRPLFLAVGLFRPHIPWEVPQKWFDLYPIDEVQLPKLRDDDLDDAHDHGRRNWHKWVTDNDQWPHLMRGYLASISYVDHQLGRLLDALDASPMKDNTIVVLWSDHGFHIGEKENWEKFALWDQTTHVPLFIHAPGLSRDGQKTQQPATLTDVYPTLCELAGISVPVQCDGVSLVPQLKNPQAARTTPALTSYQFDREETSSHAVADTRYRLIKYGNGIEELYDLQEDPHEFNNRASDPKLSDVRSRLTESLPVDAAPNLGVPTDSPYHRGRNLTKKPGVADDR